MKFILDKSKWLRGEPGEGTLHRVSDGRMCCLGQLAHQCGVRIPDLTGNNAPEHLAEAGKLPAELDWLMTETHHCDDEDDREWTTVCDSDDANDAMSANDSDSTTDEQKIERLRSIFARHGIELEVVEGES